MVHLTADAVKARTRPADVKAPFAQDDREYFVDDEDYDLGVCMSCGMYGRPGKSCHRTAKCREFGSEYI